MRRQLFGIIIMALAAGLPMTASAGVMDWFNGTSKSELVEHSSGGTILREKGLYKKGTFLPAIAGPAVKHSSGGSILVTSGRYVSETYARIPAPVRNRLASDGSDGFCRHLDRSRMGPCHCICSNDCRGRGLGLRRLRLPVFGRLDPFQTPPVITALVFMIGN